MASIFLFYHSIAIYYGLNFTIKMVSRVNQCRDRVDHFFLHNTHTLSLSLTHTHTIGLLIVNLFHDKEITVQPLVWCDPKDNPIKIGSNKSLDKKQIVLS
jgi:hypothetical protein